jgi:hypothetical protein
MRRRFLLAALPLAILATLAWADEPSPRSAVEQARQWQRNRELVKVLVDSGLHLAGEDDVLERASQCAGVASQLAGEIRQAARQREGGRVAELGQHLQALLEQGVAANLTRAREAAPNGTSLERQLKKLQEQTASVVGPLEDELQRSVDAETREDVQRALKALRTGRTGVEKALSSKK